MQKKLLTISYLGTNYHGWQVQPNGVTVQETLQNAMQSLFGTRPDLTGCSRTDAGVHARMFCCHCCVDTGYSNDDIVKALNHFLPNDISVLDCKDVNDTFHARYSSTGKNYVYRIYNGRHNNPFEYGRAYHVPRALDVESMNAFAKQLIGRHDFSAFQSAGSSVTDCVRTITECSVKKSGDVITVFVSADGFLYNMVRIIVGTLLYVSDKKIDVNDAERIINSKDRKCAGPTAPPQGLYLNKVFYEGV